MAYPVEIHGPEGEQFNTYASARWPLGTMLVMQDGRKFRFCKAGGAALVRGEVHQGPANVTNHIDLTAAVTAAGTRSPVVTPGATAAVINEYQGGYLHITVTPDGGSYYVIADHEANAGSVALTLNLAQGHAIQTAWSTSTRTNLIHNLYREVIRAPITTLTMAINGIGVKAVAINAFGWLQTSGPCAVFTSGTLILGNSASWIQVAAALGPPAAVATDSSIGHVMRVGATGAFSLVNLHLD